MRTAPGSSSRCHARMGGHSAGAMRYLRPHRRSRYAGATGGRSDDGTAERQGGSGNGRLARHRRRHRAALRGGGRARRRGLQGSRRGRGRGRRGDRGRRRRGHRDPLRRGADLGMRRHDGCRRRGLRRHRHPRQQRRHLPADHDRRDQRGRLGQPDGHQRQGHLFRGAGGAAAHGGARRRQDHQHRLDRRRDGNAELGRLLRHQGRDQAAHQVAGARPAPAQHPGQQPLARLRRVAGYRSRASWTRCRGASARAPVDGPRDRGLHGLAAGALRRRLLSRRPIPTRGRRGSAPTSWSTTVTRAY